MGTIVGVPRKYVICGKNQKMAEINFLAVHSKLREKRMAQIIISEMMRRCRLNKLPVQFYTSHHSKPTPFCSNGYKLKFINPARVLDCGIAKCGVTQSYKEFCHKHRLPDKSKIEI